MSRSLLTPPTEAEIIRHVLGMVRSNKWGFVIYRCTYGDDARWEQCISILKEYAYERLESWNAGPEVVESLQWTIIEDSATLEKANHRDVAARFHEWVKTEGERERAELVEREADAALPPPDYTSPHMALLTPPRYWFCVSVDADAVESVINEPGREGAPRSKPGVHLPGYVTAIYIGKNILGDEDEDEDDEGDDGDQGDQEGEEEDEDEDNEDYEYMRVYAYELVTTYAGWHRIDRWFNHWREPPYVFNYMGY